MDPVIPGQAPSTPPPWTPPQVGDHLSADLELTGILGEGGTAVVYSAFHAVLRREVAAKVCTIRGRHAAEAQARLICEGQMCASIRDPRVPRVYGLDHLDDGTPYLVMEKVAGEALSRTLARWRVPLRYACEMVCDLLDTLHGVHCAGVVHRDIKPSNLLVDLRPDAAQRVYLIDFGIGKVLQGGRDDASVTQHGMLVGTPHYMAPEQVDGCTDTRADLYATGAVLYEMLAGRQPFEGDSVVEVLAAVLRDPITPLATIRPELPESLVRIVEKAMARNPDDRFESARAMRIALAATTDEIIQLGPRPDFEALARATSADTENTDDRSIDSAAMRTLAARPAHKSGAARPVRITTRTW